MKSSMKSPGPDAPVWIYGVNCVRAMIESSPREIAEIRVAEHKTEHGAKHGAKHRGKHKAEHKNNPRLSRLLEQAQAAGVVCKTRPAHEIERLVGERGHQGVAALCRLPACLGERDLEALCRPGDDPPAFLILDRVTDPANLGACLRNAEACGATALIAPSNNAAGLTPAAVKVASGAAGRVPFVRVANLARAIGLLKEQGVWVVGMSARAERPLREIDCRRAVAFVLGAEGAGLRRRTSELCDYLAMIPMRGRAESLNVSAASAICLYEMRRGRDAESE